MTTVTVTETEIQIVTVGAQGPRGIQGVPGEAGGDGEAGPQGPKGDTGAGVPTGGATGQSIRKASNADYDFEFFYPSGSANLASVSASSDDATTSTYTMTDGVAVEFKDGLNQSVFAIDDAQGASVQTDHSFRFAGRTDDNHQIQYDSDVNGLGYRGYAGHIWKMGFSGQTEGMRLTEDGLSIASITAPEASTYFLTVDDTGLVSSRSLTATDVSLGNVTNVAQIPLSYLDTDATLAANSDVKVATQKAVKAYADQLIAAANGTVYKGVIDCSANPNYPAADAGWLYAISVAGKIGGASGTPVEAGDMVICLTDGTISGNQATVGANWNVIQKNIDGAVIGPTSATDGNFPLLDGTTGKLIKNSSYSPASFVAANGGITGATKIKITYDAKGLVTNGADATTADIADSTDKRYVTDVQRTVLGNTSGTNTGDEDLSGYLTTSAAASTYVAPGVKTAFTKQQNFPAVALTSTSNHIAWNLDDAQSAKHTFTENTTLDNPTNMVDGGTYILRLTQHASSPKTLAFGNAYRFNGGIVFVPSATNGAVDILTFASDGTHMDCVGQKAFA